MATSPRFTDRIGTQIAVERAGETASTQFGTLARRQLLADGIGDAQIRSWLRRGRLHRVHPGVYAWGREELALQGQLAAGLLFAGEGAALGGLSMLWWRGLLRRRPERIHIDAPGKVASVADLEIHHPVRIRRSEHDGLPIAAFPDALIVAAKSLSHNALRLVIARAEFERVAALPEIEAAFGSGRQGARAVRAALTSHLPQLARCESHLEREFVLLCESGRVEMPEPNVRIGRYRPDMLWRRHRLIVELDGKRAHSTPAQRAADMRRQRHLESLGYCVRRFGREEVRRQGRRVLASVRAELARTDASPRFRPDPPLA